MLLFALFVLLAACAYALPQEATCATITRQIIVPTRTATYLSTDVVTVYPTTIKDLGIFTLITTLSDTTTIQTLTSTTTTCTATGVVSAPISTRTVYGKSNFVTKRELGLNPRQEAVCTKTITSYTTYGQTYTYVPAGKTSTFTAHTAFSQGTVTSIKTGGKAYAIATAFAEQPTTCGTETITQKGQTATVTLDPKCSPTAMISAYAGYGIQRLDNTPSAGATWKTNTTDASQCCQLCATSWQCAVSAWDIRTGECRLEFPVQWNTGELNCGTGAFAWYDVGPSTPMEPGTGWFLAELCGKATYGNTKPDDGT
ncbi:hypothetical protein CB0940_04248 [Cercospora beticola]|uniref:Apple domain-containing protein n=1 Tax=Cercospora beticola TaxID=122368 RepID=A0A2G5HJI1_CERBT|nr:hypothetical protein CB0940_04248 [Cercospora beticola]PIA92716.1 hypothetical protein CB0940_04248 [Cercospora beticola]WPB01471.1 hypothetical protein RHO25_006097 [Cercospora beticola]